MSRTATRRSPPDDTRNEGTEPHSGGRYGVRGGSWPSQYRWAETVKNNPDTDSPAWENVVRAMEDAVSAMP